MAGEPGGRGVSRAAYLREWRRQKSRGGTLTVRGTERAYVLHGESYAAEYRVWISMKVRCSDPSFRQYADYGGRGIKVCAEWANSFPAFLSCVGRKPSPKHTIDRIDNDGDYRPGNVRWATRAENLRNRRNTRTVCVNGRTMPFVDAADLYGVHRNTAAYRLSRGWTVNQALGIERRDV